MVRKLGTGLPRVTGDGGQIAGARARSAGEITRGDMREEQNFLPGHSSWHTEFSLGHSDQGRRSKLPLNLDEIMRIICE